MSQLDMRTEAEVASGDGAPRKEKSELAMATPRQLFWWRFGRHKLAVASAVFLLILYMIAIFAEFFAPYAPNTRSFQHAYHPPQSVHAEFEGFSLRFYVYGIDRELDQSTGRTVFSEDTSERFRVRLFGRAEAYSMFGLINTNTHLFVVEDGGRIHLLGTDSAGRDVLSQAIHGARISLFIGLLAVAASLTLGGILGGISGYFGGTIDGAIQRLIELLRSIPGLALWMSLSAAMPRSWTQIQVYFAIVGILSLLGWTTLAREVRGRVLSLKSEDFILAARLNGCSTFRILRVHLIPSLYSHMIATLTLAVPAIILAETALSFLGIGLSRPIVSWGVLLREAQNIEALLAAPWLFWPGVILVVTVLAFNFLGDGLRDAADPYSKLSG